MIRLSVIINLIAGLTALTGLAAGCTELGLVWPGGPQDTPANDTNGTAPVVILSVSNPAPQVSEEVRLMCVVVSSDNGEVTFQFHPADGRLFVDSRAGTATFIVDEADVGIEFPFTCTATNANGTSTPSNTEVVIPTG